MIMNRIYETQNLLFL